MRFVHKADLQIAEWIEKTIEKKIQKKSSSVNMTMIPYGNREEKQDENKDESTDIEKRIEQATTPEELEAIEKELSEEKPAEESTEAEKPAEGTEKGTEEKGTEKPAEEKPAESTGGESEDLKKQVKELSDKVDELSGEEKLQHEIDLLKKRLDNINVLDDTNLNDSLFQEAKTKIAYFKRCIRRSISRTAAVDPVIQQIGDIIKNEKVKLVDLRKHLETIFKKNDIVFNFEPVPHFRVRYKDKFITIVNKKYADFIDLEVNDIAIGFNKHYRNKAKRKVAS